MSGLSPRYYRDRFVRFWWLLLLCAVCAAIGGWAGAATLFSVYSSTALVEVELRAIPASAPAGVIVDRMTHTGAQLAISEGLLQPIAAHEGMSVTKLRGEVTATPVANTQLLSITVRDVDAGRSARLANAIAAAVITAQTSNLAADNAASQTPYIAQIQTLSDTITSLQSQIAQLGNPPSNVTRAGQLRAQLVGTQGQYILAQGTLARIQVAEASQTPVVRFSSPAPSEGTPVTSHEMIAAGTGAALGLALGMLLVVGGEWLNSRVRSPEGVEAAFRWRRLGYARALSGKAAPAGPARADVTHGLARDIRFLEVDGPMRVLALVSFNPTSRAIRASGVAIRLANAIARGGRNTLLVDARLDEAGLHDGFGLPREPGFSDLVAEAIRGAVTPDDVLRHVRQPARNADARLRALTAGAQAPNPARVLRSDACAKTLGAIANIPADAIVIDTAPALFAGAPESLTSVLDGVIIVVEAGTGKRALAALDAALAASAVPLLGFVYLDRNEPARQTALEHAAAGVQEAQLARK